MMTGPRHIESGTIWPAGSTHRRLWPHETMAIDAISVSVIEELFFTEVGEFYRITQQKAARSPKQLPARVLLLSGHPCERGSPESFFASS